MSARSSAATWLPRVFAAALGLLFVAIIFGELAVPGTGLAIRYKTFARALPIAWLVCLAFPAGRRALPHRPQASDLPLALFVAAAALSVAFGGGHGGDVRQLVAAIGVGLVARSLFAPPARRAGIVVLFCATFAVLLAHELSVHPDLLPPHETGRYDLVTANPNVLGFLFAMTGPLLLGVALGRRGVTRAITGVGFALAVLGVLLTFSRVAAFGLGAGCLVVVAALARRRQALVVASVLAIGFAASSRPDQWLHLRQSGDSYRPSIMATALRIGLEHPVLGVGFGINNLEEVFPDRYQALYGERIFRFHSANQLLDLLAGTGFVGTALAIWWMARVGATAIGWWRTAATPPFRTQAAGGLGAFVAIVLMSMAEPPLYHGKLLPMLFVLLAAIELGPVGDPTRTTGPVPTESEP
jgi:hypothetical protein